MRMNGKQKQDASFLSFTRDLLGQTTLFSTACESRHESNEWMSHQKGMACKRPPQRPTATSFSDSFATSTSRERKGCRRDDTIKQKEKKKETVVSFYSIKKDRGSSSSSTFYSRSKQHGRIGNYFILLYVNLYGCLLHSKSLRLKLTMKFNL